MNRYALIIEEYACWGCRTCEVACKQEHNTPEDVKYISVTEDGPKLVSDKLDFTYRVNVCRHCDEPLCKDACPVGAITKREDGIVILDEEECTGCESCIEACPYKAISFDSGKGVARKCNLCYFRVDNGLYPACADNVCLAHCIYFDSPEKIEQIIAEKKRRREG
jgi:Fe-S-cluster-containing dehydrogenase component